MKKIETTYGEFYEMFKNNPEKTYYVKTHKEEYAEILDVGTKQSEMVQLEFAGTYKLKCSTGHHFMNKNGDAISASELKLNKKILTLNGLIPVTSIKKLKTTDCIDIAIDAPHWYVNDDFGIIHHNSNMSLLIAESYLKKYPDAFCLFLDNEGGSPEEYFISAGIDPSRVIHGFFTSLEELRHELSVQLRDIERGENVIIIVDSLGGGASLKETNDAEDNKSAADFTRAKTLKSLFRIITPTLIMKDIPLIVINHVYDEIGLAYKSTKCGGGSGPMLASDNCWIIGRQQEKEAGELEGYNFIINVEKSRYVKEKSKIPITVKFDKGISRYSGLLDIALELGFVIKPKNGWYSRVIDGVIEDKKYREKDTDNKMFWNDILKQKSFQDAIENRYKLMHGELLVDDSDIENTYDALDDIALEE